jgi:hypothetical protein
MLNPNIYFLYGFIFKTGKVCIKFPIHWGVCWLGCCFLIGVIVLWLCCDCVWLRCDCVVIALWLCCNFLCVVMFGGVWLLWWVLKYTMIWKKKRKMKYNKKRYNMWSLLKMNDCSMLDHCWCECILFSTSSCVYEKIKIKRRKVLYFFFLFFFFPSKISCFCFQSRLVQSKSWGFILLIIVENISLYNNQ